MTFVIEVRETAASVSVDLAGSGWTTSLIMAGDLAGGRSFRKDIDPTNPALCCSQAETASHGEVDAQSPSSVRPG
jgi:hypothetical protein